MLKDDVRITVPTYCRVSDQLSMEVSPGSWPDPRNNRLMVRAINCHGDAVFACTTPGCNWGYSLTHYTFTGVRGLFVRHTCNNVEPEPEPEPQAGVEIGTGDGTTITNEQFETMLRLFKHSWHQADQCGLTGGRTEAGLISALLVINVTIEEIE